MATLKLYMVLIGCTPAGRTTEQHDVFFGVGSSLKEMLPDMLAFWPEAQGRIHLDAWREVCFADGYEISILPRTGSESPEQEASLFFLNLGGYKPGEFEEYHYKMVVAAVDKAAAVRQARKTAFYRHTGFKGAAAHIDDKYGIDVDDVHRIADILPEQIKNKYSIRLQYTGTGPEDELHIGYVKLSTI